MGRNDRSWLVWSGLWSLQPLAVLSGAFWRRAGSGFGGRAVCRRGGGLRRWDAPPQGGGDLAPRPLLTWVMPCVTLHRRTGACARV